jgi:hypothetical protein
MQGLPCKLLEHHTDATATRYTSTPSLQSAGNTLRTSAFTSWWPAAATGTYLWLADVSCELHALASLLLHQCHRLLSILVLIKVHDGHVSTLTRKVDSHGAADARVTTWCRNRWRATHKHSLCRHKRLSVEGDG